ncbi:glycosyl hydrolase family 28-related protein [Kiritimatiella glycovorans]|uniref:Rhamnogalacturonase A/B/Epimerase-like pectate lyase domain-containing protein n=1 Tax=Kiritimatiella glycovorans TaxID=1307763 RepID=A0A0G3EFP0_9BACT|nr:glycosyl hydrolase family 28-related protein [Kiritimatiella glycovorans]AKJ65163.1 hypothetical protein L21SP4_01928 [Kiritimatiella glycovorans]
MRTLQPRWFWIFAVFTCAALLARGEGALLLEYNFSDDPTPSKMDAEYIDPDLAATDITEYGDPDASGTSPELANFAGYSLNIKRNALDTHPMNSSDYLTFTVRTADTNRLIDPDHAELRFNQFSDDFSFVIYVDAGEGFREAATLGGASNSSLRDTIRDLDLDAVPASTSLVFRIECAHAAPGSALNTTLQFAHVKLYGELRNAGQRDSARRFPRLTRLADASDRLALRWPGVQGSVYRVESTTHLVGGTWGPEATNLVGAGGFCAVTNTAEGNRRFYRVRKTAAHAPAYAYHDIRDYGAVLNDGLDDSDAVQAAIDAAAASRWNGTVYFPPGVTTITRPLEMRIFVSLLGAGTPGEAGGSVLRAAPSAELTSMLWGRDPAVRFLSIEHLTFDGAGLEIPWIIDFEDAINLRIANVRIENVRGGGIRQLRSDGDPCWVNFYENIEIEIRDHSGTGFIHGDSDSHLADLRISGADVGILEIDGGANLYRNCVVSNCMTGMVLADGADWRHANSVCDSIFRDNVDYGLAVTNAAPAHIVINGNVFRDNGERDIFLQDASCLAIRGNEFQSALPRDAIFMEPGTVDSVALTGNRFARSSQSLEGAKSVRTENVFGLTGSEFEGIERLEIGPPPIVPGDVPCDINVKDAPYLAAGNKSDDDTAALQAALDTAPDGSIVYIPPGRYMITEPLEIRSSITLLGEYAATYIVADAPMDCIIRGAPESGFLEDVLISSLTLSGNNTNVAAAVRLDGLRRSTLDRVDVRYLPGHGIVVPEGCDGNLIRSCNIHSADTQLVVEGAGTTIASVYAGGGMYYDELEGSFCGVRLTGDARFTRIYTSHIDHTRRPGNIAALHFTHPTAFDQSAIIRNSYFDLHDRGLFFDYDEPATANILFKGNIFRAVNDYNYLNGNADGVYLYGSVFLDNHSDAYIRHESGELDYIEVIGNVFREPRSYSLPGSHSIDAANTTQE